MGFGVQSRFAVRIYPNRTPASLIRIFSTQGDQLLLDIVSESYDLVPSEPSIDYTAESLICPTCTLRPKSGKRFSDCYIKTRILHCGGLKIVQSSLGRTGIRPIPNRS